MSGNQPNVNQKNREGDQRQRHVVVREIVGERECVAAFEVVHQLRTHLTLESFMAIVSEMSTRGYRMFGLYHGNKLVSFAGVEVMTNLYNGRHLWVYDLVTDTSERAKGYGAKLLEYLEEFARQNSCRSVVLSSGASRVDAHRFYERSGYEVVSKVFKRQV